MPLVYVRVCQYLVLCCSVAVQRMFCSKSKKLHFEQVMLKARLCLSSTCEPSVTSVKPSVSMIWTETVLHISSLRLKQFDYCYRAWLLCSFTNLHKLIIRFSTVKSGKSMFMSRQPGFSQTSRVPCTRLTTLHLQRAHTAESIFEFDGSSISACCSMPSWLNISLSS